MSTTKSRILLALATAFLSATEAQKTVKCDPKNRPAIESCYQDPYTPVCGYYTDNCPFSICSATQSSACYACADPTIQYYKAGECTTPQVDVCSSDICSMDYNPSMAMEKDIFYPVCGIKKKCGKGDCDMTFDNVCESCAQKSYPFYQNGPCESDKKYCKGTRPKSCRTTGSPVCASFTDSDNVTHFTTADNACNACKDPSVSYYLLETCGKPSGNQTYCLPNNRPAASSCSGKKDQVCGFYKDKDGIIQHKIIDNSCSACAEKDILYHTPGPCVFYCDRNPFIVYDCAGSLNPVCGVYKENGVTKKVSLRNSCLGCYYSQYNLESYTEGLCPGDNGILCANNGGAFLEGQLNPVCGLTSLNCKSGSCRKTYADPYSACGAEKVVKYLPGPCPGDYGVSCADYRFGMVTIFTYDNVCGYKKANCKDNSCRANYKDQYDACKNTNVLYFSQGPC